MTKLNAQARQVLKDAGVSVRAWIAYGGWRETVVDAETGKRRWGAPLTTWHGDECGCTDDRCIGYHHDAGEECGCLPVLIERRATSHEAYAIWQDYRAAVEAGDGRGDPDAYDDAWTRAEYWVRHRYPDIETFSLDTVVKGRRGITGTYPLKPGQNVPEWAVPDERGYRITLWSEGVDPDGYELTQFEEARA